MCGRVRLATEFSDIRRRIKFDPAYPAPNVPASWNVCPTDPMLVAIRSEAGKRIPQQMRWGLVPWWAKERSIAQCCNFIASCRKKSVLRAFREAILAERAGFEPLRGRMTM